MSKILKENKEIVAPGETIAEGMSYIPGNGTYRLDDNVVSERIGIVKVNNKIIKVIPLSGPYIPKVNDLIVAKVTDTTGRGWKLEYGGPNSALLGTRETNFGRLKPSDRVTDIMDIGQYVALKIDKLANNMFALCTMKGPKCRKLDGGRVIEVDSTKVPRIIGRKGSMIGMIKGEMDTDIVVGINGLIWLNGNYINEVIAIKAIRKIENESHLSGLTDKIKEFLTEMKEEYKEVKDELGEY